MSRTKTPAVFISAKRQDNIDELRNVILQEVCRLYAEIYPYKYIADPYAYPETDSEA
jgi:50S ribosomal subunit-associated GTPase HflX